MTHPFFARDVDADIGLNIRRLREEGGLTVAHLAARCGIAPERLTEAEAGAHLAATDLLTVMQRLGCDFPALLDHPRAERGPS